MQGLNWGDLYERFHSNAYNHNELSAKVAELYADDYVSDHKGIFEYVLGSHDVRRSALPLRLSKNGVNKQIKNKIKNEVGSFEQPT